MYKFKTHEDSLEALSIMLYRAGISMIHQRDACSAFIQLFDLHMSMLISASDLSSLAPAFFIQWQITRRYVTLASLDSLF